MKRFRKYAIGGLLILGAAVLAGSNSECEFNNDDDFDFDFDDDDNFFKPILGDGEPDPATLAAKLYPLFPSA
jgi:hypothetical protein